jgi:hypothetical protein
VFITKGRVKDSETGYDFIETEFKKLTVEDKSECSRSHQDYGRQIAQESLNHNRTFKQNICVDNAAYVIIHWPKV